uniref:Zinc knuckle CX2CX4HX4C domain-containing protein n=1 Tax=Brassica oleracea TaxID=3712 RepID=A0A3P6GWD3_BRAOL|nr:unnamed protein product [Brassica oleracea]
MSRRYARHEKEKWIPSASLAPKRSPVRIPANNNDSLIAANKLTIIVSGKNAEDARVRVDMNGLNPLTMNLEVRLPSDEVITLEFEYLKLEKHCFTCFSLLHEEVDCPHRPHHQLPPKNRKLGITQRIALHRIEIEKKRHDDRRGYTRYQPASRSNQAHNYEDRGRRANEIVYAHDTSSRTQRREGPSSAQQDRMDPLSTRRDMSHPQRMDHSRELSSGKIVSSREPHTIRDLSVGYTSKANDSQSSHTPPSRPIRERMDLPNEPSSERTLSTSRERRSALERIAEPDLRHTPSFKFLLESWPPYLTRHISKKGRHSAKHLSCSRGRRRKLFSPTCSSLAQTARTTYGSGKC